MEQEFEVLHSTKWLELRRKNGYVYMHSPWCKAEAVCVLPFKDVAVAGRSYLTVIEHRPCHGDTQEIYSITGGCDKEGELPIDTAVREVIEETGYQVRREMFIPLGIIRDCKASDMLLHAFAVEIPNGTPLLEPEGDGSETEKNAYASWASERQAVCDSPDPLISQMILRLKYQDRFKD